jgi:uncharacterized membrane protein
MNRLKNFDWEAVAGIAAALVALILHLVGVAAEGVLLSVALVILALILLRSLRKEANEERSLQLAERIDAKLAQMRSLLSPSDTVLIGPQSLLQESERFAASAQGEMTWFNVCLLMFVRQALFDVLLKPAIENPHVRSIQFILDEGERERWASAVLPKIVLCTGKEKVREPAWTNLHEPVSFILTDIESGKEEAHLSFWGEPFMARTAGGDVPRYIFHVQAHSELIPRLVELGRHYRLASHNQENPAGGKAV